MYVWMHDGDLQKEIKSRGAFTDTIRRGKRQHPRHTDSMFTAHRKKTLLTTKNISV